MDNFAAGAVASDSSQATSPLINIPGVAFREVPLSEMVSNLERYYNELKAFITRPGVVRYDELVMLRRRAAQADLGSTSFSRFQSQLRLAVELLRLGRRAEGFALLTQIEERLPVLPKAEDMRSVAVVYGLWLALVRAAVGNTTAALESAQRLVATSPDSVMSTAILTFFHNLYQPRN